MMADSRAARMVCAGGVAMPAVAVRTLSFHPVVVSLENEQEEGLGGQQRLGLTEVVGFARSFTGVLGVEPPQLSRARFLALS